MTIPVARQSTARKTLASLLTGHLVGTDRPCNAVYAYKVGDIKRSPLVVVTSRGVDHERSTFAGNSIDSFLIDIFVFVPMYSNDPSFPWTEENAEDRADIIEQMIDEILPSLQSGAYWKSLEHDGPSERDVIEIGGIAYSRERIPFVMGV